MAEQKLHFRCDAERMAAVKALAVALDLTISEVIRDSMPTPAVADFFLQNRVLNPTLKWGDVVIVGVRQHLLELYKKNMSKHLARLGCSMDSTVDEINAARDKALSELENDKEHPLRWQLQKARENPVYLGCLYDAWKRAKAGQAGFRLVKIEVGFENGEPTVSWVVKVNGIAL